MIEDAAKIFLLIAIVCAILGTLSAIFEKRDK